MKQVGILPTNNWIEKEETLDLFYTFNTFDIKAKFVGGCVRDALLKIASNDIDIAVNAPAEYVLSSLRSHNIIVHPVGIDHGSMIATIGDMFFQITSLRKDTNPNGRHTEIEHTTSWEEDAKRRDFTINALYADIDRKLYDPTGLGLKDLREKRIRFIGKPELRIQEDYLRILRFFRFYAFYGNNPVPKTTLETIKNNSKNLNIISKERKTHELLRLLESESPIQSIQLMKRTQTWENILKSPLNTPEILFLEKIYQKSKQINLQISNLLALFTLNGGVKSSTDNIISNLSMSKSQKQTINHLHFILRNNIHKALRLSDLKKSLYFWKKQHVIDLFIYYITYNNTKDLDLFVDTIKNWSPPIFPVSGDEVIEEGAPQGPIVGKILNETRQLWIDKNFEPTKDELIKTIKEKIKALTIQQKQDI